MLTNDVRQQIPFSSSLNGFFAKKKKPKQAVIVVGISRTQHLVKNDLFFLSFFFFHILLVSSLRHITFSASFFALKNDFVYKKYSSNATLIYKQRRKMDDNHSESCLLIIFILSSKINHITVDWLLRLDWYHK